MALIEAPSSSLFFFLAEASRKTGAFFFPMVYKRVRVREGVSEKVFDTEWNCKFCPLSILSSHDSPQASLGCLCLCVCACA